MSPIRLAFAVAALILFPAAGEAEGLGVPIKEVSVRFSDSARALKLTQRMVNRSCDNTGPVLVCTGQIGTNLKTIATAMPDRTTVKEFSLVFGGPGNKNEADFLQAILAAVHTFTPDAAARKRVFDSIAAAATDQRQFTSVVIGNLEFSTAFGPPAMFVVSPAD